MINHKTHIEFIKLDYKEFCRRYKKGHQLIVDIDKFKNCKVGLKIADINTFIYHANGNSQEMLTRYNIRDKTNPIIVRIPALRVYDSYLAMDGNHRLRELKPSIVIIDYIKVTKKTIKYSQDLSNVHWQAYINRDGEGFVY